MKANKVLKTRKTLKGRIETWYAVFSGSRLHVVSSDKEYATTIAKQDAVMGGYDDPFRVERQDVFVTSEGVFILEPCKDVYATEVIRKKALSKLTITERVALGLDPVK